MKLRYLLLGVLVVLVVLGALLAGPARAHTRVVLLLSQTLPVLPVKPLALVTAPPAHEQIRLEAAHGRIVVDRFLPAGTTGSGEAVPRPALVLAMGIKVSEQDRPILLGLAETLSRLGYVVIWPRLEPLDQGVALPEDPRTFVESVRYLQGLDVADPARISVIGFSVGASIALVAAQDPAIANNLRALVFFGGYYDLLDFLLSLATQTATLDGQQVAWHPSGDALGHVHEILRTKGLTEAADVLQAGSRAEAEALLAAAPQAELAALRQLSPSAGIERVRTRMFILHDKRDEFIHYFESERLHRALPPHVEKTYLPIELFEHVQFGTRLDWATIREASRLYGFLLEVFGYL
jgi:predicted esterase